MRVYLAGPINGCSDEEARGWRELAKQLRPEIEWVDPMDRDYRGQEDANAEVIVERDCADILSCDKVLRKAWPVSEGSAQETMLAHVWSVPVVAFCDGPVSPWLRAHADVHPTLEAAVEAIWGTALQRAIDEVQRVIDHTERV